MPVILYRTFVGKLADLEIDAIVTEQHKGDVDVTDFPVEVGANITDHARLKPLEVTLTGVISNTPVSRKQMRRVIQSQGVNITTTATSDSPAGATGYVESALAKLDKLRVERQFVTVVTAIKTYSKMMVTSVTIPRDAKSGDAISFTVVLKQVTVANIRHQEVQTLAEPKANKKVDTGKKATPKATGPQKRKSWSKQILDGLGKRIPTPADLTGGT